MPEIQSSWRDSATPIHSGVTSLPDPYDAEVNPFVAVPRIDGLGTASHRGFVLRITAAGAVNLGTVWMWGRLDGETVRIQAPIDANDIAVDVDQGRAIPLADLGMYDAIGFSATGSQPFASAVSFDLYEVGIQG